MLCAIFGCCSSNKKNSKSYIKCRFFSFPKNKKMCNKWIYKCGQGHKFNINTARICCKHFSDDDYLLKGKILKLPKDKWKLKPDAIPSLHLASNIEVHIEIPHSQNQLKNCEAQHESEFQIKTENAEENMSEIFTEERLDISQHELENQIITENAEKNMSVTFIKERRSISTQTTSSSELLEEIWSLQSSITHLKQCLQRERYHLKSMEKIFTEGQIRKLKTGRQIQWSVNDITFAFSIYAAGPRAYKLLRKRGYPLPGILTIQRWASKLKMQPDAGHLVSTEP